MADVKPTNLAHLEETFQTFNRLSEELASSYHALQTQVVDLQSKLSRAQDGHVKQFEETRRLANRLECLLEALPAGVVVLDGLGVVRESNPVAVELLGQPLAGESWRKVITRCFAPQFDDGHEVSLRDGRRVSIATSSLGREPGQIILLKDVTETRRLQDRLARLQQMSAMGHMAATLAHQIRTPVASALLYVSHLCSNNIPFEKSSAYALKIKAQLQHIESMVRDMLSITRGESENHDDEFPLSMLLEGLETTVISQIEDRGGVLKINNTAGSVVVNGNYHSLLGAFTNLIINAIAASNNSVEIIVTSKLSDDALQIEVSDKGEGIPDHVKNSLYEPFVTTKIQGTGLGLAVVKSVIDKHGGEIGFVTESGVGTTFIVKLPLVKGDDIKNEVNGFINTKNKSEVTA
ncbi:MAG: HAMP domain-containing histidine kinase [Gammaproteobacteria bacterium]|nr:HAMP domain-containing histidine kinase [Gammaproteobacteria bacterium]